MTVRKKAILNAAARLFAERGFEATSTAEVAKAAGVSEGTIFHHFTTKDGVLIHLFQELTALYLEGVRQEAREATSGLDAIERMMRFHFRFVDEHSLEALVIFRDIPVHLRTSDSPQRSFMVGYVLQLFHLFEECLERGRLDGSVREIPAQETAFILRAMLVGLTRQKLFGVHPVPDLSEEVILFCRRSLATPGA